jgi:hypothetical protein
MKTNWIKLEDYGPPDEEGTYLCLFSDGEMETLTFDGPPDTDWWRHTPEWSNVSLTHWCELPDPPATITELSP